MRVSGIRPETFTFSQMANLLLYSRKNFSYRRTSTQLKDNCQLPPPDNLMRHLIDLANTDNPPCSNCDKRDRPSMFFCSTCGRSRHFLMAKFSGMISELRIFMHYIFGMPILQSRQLGVFKFLKCIANFGHPIFAYFRASSM